MVVEVTSSHKDLFDESEGKGRHEYLEQPVLLPPPRDRFLVSFLVDARGGSMRGSRHPGLRVLVPPGAASAPTRVTCRMLRPERTTRPPQLNDSEGLACRLIELGPHPCTFNCPVLLEIPHFASLRGRQRELVVLRSDNGETWREHSLEATDQAVQSALGQAFDTLETLEELRTKRIIRILTNDFPQYLAIVTRLRQETALVGSDGGVLSSTVVPQVQAVFPEGALQKRIRVGLQAQPIPQDLVTRLLGNRVAVSPIVTLEPRRRKFHKPITLTIPLPRTAHKGMMNQSHSSKSHGTPSLRLLCSITGGTLPAQWEDITVPTPLSKVKDCVSFTTTVSARFWLLDCPNVHDSTELARQLYHEASLVPYMGKFVVFNKHLDADEALIRCFCVTDDKVDKTLECQEGFEVCAASPEVEVLEGRATWLETVGNLLPVTKAGEQLSLHFNAFRENRLAFPVRVRDLQAEQSGKLAFLREPRTAANVENVDPAHAAMLVDQKPICTLEINLGSAMGIRDGQSTDLGVLSLSDQVNSSLAASSHSIPCVFPTHQTEDKPMSDPGLARSGSRLATLYASDVIARSQLDLLQVASEVGSDWPRLAPILIPESGLDASATIEHLVDWVTHNESRWQGTESGGGFSGLTVDELRTSRDQALVLLLAWKELRGDAATGNELDRALRLIGRMDVVKSCMRDIQCVMDEDEHTVATKRIDQEAPNPFAEVPPTEPASTSLVGTVTLMSGMEDLPIDQVTGTRVKKDTELSSERPTEIEEVVAHSEQEILAEAPPVYDAVENAKHEQLPDQDMGISLPKSNEHSVQDDLVEDYTEEQWQASCPPATSTSKQGGDPLLNLAEREAITDADADIVRESESMTGSFEERPSEELKDSSPTHGGDTSGETSGQVEEQSGEEPKEVDTIPGQSIDATGVEGSPSGESVEPLQSAIDELVREDHHVNAVDVPHEDTLMDAHHDGGEVPTDADASLPLSYHNAEVVEMVNEDHVSDLPEPQVDQSNLSTAHHGITAEQPLQPPTE